MRLGLHHLHTPLTRISSCLTLFLLPVFLPFLPPGPKNLKYSCAYRKSLPNSLLCFKTPNYFSFHSDVCTSFSHSYLLFATLDSSRRLILRLLLLDLNSPPFHISFNFCILDLPLDVSSCRSRPRFEFYPDTRLTFPQLSYCVVHFFYRYFSSLIHNFFPNHLFFL